MCELTNIIHNTFTIIYNKHASYSHSINSGYCTYLKLPAQHMKMPMPLSMLTESPKYSVPTSTSSTYSQPTEVSYQVIHCIQSTIHT